MDISHITEAILQRVDAHKLAPGSYSRYLWQDATNSRQMGLNAYGCADAINILYTLNRFPTDSAEQAAAIAALQSKQDPETGFFLEPSHNDFHTTAHCIAALDLLNARPLYPLNAMKKYLSIDLFFHELEEQDWLHNGGAAHAGAGLYAALAITDSAGSDWQKAYFTWFTENCSPATGLWAKEPVTARFSPGYQMGDSFHYLFNYDYANEPFPYPEKLIDSCLEMYRNGTLLEGFGKKFHFIEMDWVFCLNRASRQTPHRFYEVKDTLWEFACQYIRFLEDTCWETNEGANDMHLLFGATCCLAELQLALPGKIRSPKPLRVVLDRRPFI